MNNDDDLIRRGDALRACYGSARRADARIAALPAVQPAPECLHPFCGDKCGEPAAHPAPDVAVLVKAAGWLKSDMEQRAKIHGESHVQASRGVWDDFCAALSAWEAKK